MTLFIETGIKRLLIGILTCTQTALNLQFNLYFERYSTCIQAVHSDVIQNFA